VLGVCDLPTCTPGEARIGTWFFPPRSQSFPSAASAPAPPTPPPTTPWPLPQQGPSRSR